MSTSKYLYMQVTNDEYELPIAVCDTPTELARTVGTTVSTVVSSISREENGIRKTSIYKRVLKDDSEEKDG